MTKDQKRALGLGGAGVGGLLLWRHFHPSSSSNNSGLTNAAAGTGATGAIQPYTPQEPLTLSPGESVYDPNSGGLYNTPTAPYSPIDGTVYGPSGTGAISPDPSLGSGPAIYYPPPQSVAPTMPHYAPNHRHPKPVTRKKANRKPTKRKVTVHRPTNHSHVKKTATPKTRKKKVHY